MRWRAELNRQLYLQQVSGGGGGGGGCGGGGGGGGGGVCVCVGIFFYYFRFILSSVSFQVPFSGRWVDLNRNTVSK